jgi:hypothetical protein
MSKRVDTDQALQLLEHLYSICMLTTNFSLSTVLENNNCNGFQPALIDAEFIAPIKTKNSWLWMPEHAPSVVDAKKLLDEHYCDKNASTPQSNFNFDKGTVDAVADMIASHVVNYLRPVLPELIKSALSRENDSNEH